MVAYIEEVIIPYVDRVHETLDVGEDQAVFAPRSVDDSNSVAN